MVFYKICEEVAFEMVFYKICEEVAFEMVFYKICEEELLKWSSTRFVRKSF